MKNSKKILSKFLLVTFTIYVTMGNVSALAISSGAITAKVKEATALVAKSSAVQNVAKTKVTKAKKYEIAASVSLKAATVDITQIKKLEDKMLSIASMNAAKAVVDCARTNRILADKELALSMNSYKLAVIAKSAAEKIAKVKSSQANAAAKIADVAIKAAKDGANKAVNAAKLSKTATDKYLQATKTASIAVAKVAEAKVAAEKAAAEKAAAEKAAAEKAAAEKAAAEKAAAEKAAAEAKAAAEKAAAEKAAAEKAALEAAMKIKVTSIVVIPAGNATMVTLGNTLQLTTAVAPVNAWDKSIIWRVANGTGTATIDNQTGLLRGITAGTVTVIAINTTSGIIGELVINVIVPAPTLTGYKIAPGSVLKSTKITYTPSGTNMLRYVRQATAFTTQATGTNMSTSATAYISGYDIYNVSVGEHIGLYEVDTTGKVVRFVDITLIADNIAAPAPVITGFIIAPGTVATSTKITYTPAVGNTLRYIKQAGAFLVPMIGTTVAGTVYTSGRDITGVAPLQHIGLYEVNSTSTIVRFIDITVLQAFIATPAPVITGHVIGAGTLAASTKITYVPAAGNTLRYAQQATAFVLPLVGTSVGSNTVPYTSGTNILNAVIGQHIGLYEVNSAIQVVKFIDITLVANNIAIGAATPIITGYLVEPGTATGSTKITYTPGSGNTLKYVKQSTAFTTPLVGSDISLIGTAYTSGTNITSAVAGQHIGLYEIDAARQLVKFVDITLGAGNIAVALPAQTITGYVVEQGMAIGSTKITYAVGTGNSLRYFKQSAAFSVPLTGNNVSAISAPYVSGADITGAMAGQHIGLYEVDNSMLVVKFVDITLGAGNIKAAAPAPAITGCVIEQGTVAGSTKITVTPNDGNTLRYFKQTSAFSTPMVNTNVATISTPYASGSNILNAAPMEHIGLYEVDKDNLVVRFIDITLTAGNIAAAALAQPISVYTIQQGTVVGSTKIVCNVSTTGNKLRYVVQSVKVTTPFDKEDASNVGQLYTSGDNITGLSVGQHIGLYEVDSSGLVVRFVDIELLDSNIARIATTLTGYTVLPGITAGSTKISYTKGDTNKLRILKQPNAFNAPFAGADASGIGIEYTAGDEILNVQVGEHIGLFETDQSDKVINFVDIVVTLAMIAPTP